MDDWPPPEARLRGAIWRAEGELERAEYFAASRTLADVFEIAGDQQALVRALHHLAAAGFKHQSGDARGAARQLAHARRRLAGFPDASPLLELVARDIES
jgi:hypothetical protein